MSMFQGGSITWGEFKKVLEDNLVSPDAKIYSDSGWEYGSTGVFCAYYNPSLQVVVLTQCSDPDYEGKEWINLF